MAGAITAIFEVIAQGGMAAGATLLLIAWAFERWENRTKAQKLIELATAQIQFATELKNAVQSQEKILSMVLDRL